MKFLLSLAVTLIVLVLVVACGDAGDPTTTREPSGDEQVPDEAEDQTFPRPTVTSLPVPETDSQELLPEGYPALPTPSPYPEGYPVPPTPLPTVDPYPAGECVWIIRPVGEQCAEADDSDYADLQEAVAALTAAGVDVKNSGVADLIVCAACGCPTSAHFRVEIAVSDLARAESLGWTVGE
jgi:hypothetical protein